MMEIYKTQDEGKDIGKISVIEKRCWIDLSEPTEDELNYVQHFLGVEPSFLRDPLDEEEKPRVDVENNQVLIIVDLPYVGENALNFGTIPMGIIVMEEHIITVCSRRNHIIELFKKNKIKTD